MKRFIVSIALASLTLAVIAGSRGHGQQIPAEFKSRIFMQRKLSHAHKVLEGIVLEDYGAVEKNAKTLSLLSQAAEWQILPTAEYRKHGEDFRRITDALAKAALDRNLDGTALKYVEMTLNCVNCHKHVRTFRTESETKPAHPSREKFLLDKP